MILTVINAFELLLASILHLMNISNIQRLLYNHHENKKTKICLIPYFIACVFCSVYREKARPMIFFFSVLTFYSLLFAIQIGNSSRSKLKAGYITLSYLILDSIVQSLVYISIRLATNVYNRSAIINTASIVWGVILYFVIKRANSLGNQIRNSVDLISRRIYVFILLTVFFTGNLCSNMSVDSYEINFEKKLTQFLTIFAILSFLIVMINFIFKSISKEYYENLSRLMEKAVEQQLKHYDKVSELNEELREFRHDYKNHMICLQSLMEAQAYQQADEYIKNITKQDIIESKNYFSGNRTADAILSDKNETAQKNGAWINFSGCISDEISPTDLCTILSNALDNAIEACERIGDSGSLCVNVDCAVIQNVQIVKIRNPNNVDSTVSAKADKDHHGIGLYNIRRTVERLNGQMTIPQKVPEFILELEFPIK